LARSVVAAAEIFSDSREVFASYDKFGDFA
jgi:hypothetical protein